MQKILSFLTGLFLAFMAGAQDTATLSLTVLDAGQQPLAHATVALRQWPDSALVKVLLSAVDGRVVFERLRPATYICQVSHAGFADHYTAIIDLHQTTTLPPVVMQPASALAGVTVVARKPFVELKPGRTVVNVEAGITTAGATAMEALEKMPGITIDRDGAISLKGRSGVLVLIDGKQTFLDAAQLSTLLNGMNASQIEQVEIMDQPPAGYDAAGNAGTINIKTKKNRQRGFNGSITTSYAQGYYPKNNNSLQVAYCNGRWNLSGNYSVNFNNGFTRVYALRTYFKPDGTVASLLDQPGFFKSAGNTHDLRLSADYSISDKTSLGLTLTGLSLGRTSNNTNRALWLNAQKAADSLIITDGRNNSSWQNAGATLSFRHLYSSSRELTADVDVIGYRMVSEQFFENRSQFPAIYSEAIRADIPSELQIVSAKTDYHTQWKDIRVAGGLKASYINTDNLAAYEIREGAGWKPDFGKSNHFLYNEKIQAAYISGERKLLQWSLQAGLRYEATAYDATQLGNAVQKDSSFSRRYSSLFPSMLVSFDADSNHTFSLSAGRRIDRPAFQKLNPFIFIINKYTYQQGNPFFRPQYTWNMELSHVYKSRWITGIGYSITTDYFSQIFPLDNSGLVIYTEGNLGRLQQFTVSLSTQLTPTGWWSLSAQATGVHKKMEGVIGRQLRASITQATLNVANQFRLKKGWSAELTGFYTSRSQADIQEIVDPAGQLSVGVAKALWKNKATVKLAARDIFHTQWMKGNTFFPAATEYFKLTRDTRVALLSFSYRFGKTFKASRRSEGSAGEEIRRVGNG